jgi:hypothetical protein
MDSLSDRIREWIASERKSISVPGDLDAQVLLRVRSAPRIAPHFGWRRQVAASVAVLLFVGLLGLGFSRLRVLTTSTPLPAPSHTASPIPTATAAGVPVMGPGARFDAGMAFDPRTGVSVLFGGQGADGNSRADTWTWNGNRWTKLYPKVSPPARVGGRLVFDQRHHSILLYGGIGTVSPDSIGALSDLWSWDGSTWTQLHPKHMPPARASASVAYDETTNSVVLFGGETGDRAPVAMNDTWLWNGNDWIQQPGNAPPPRSDAAMVFDQASSELILFGGADGVPLNDTWAWNGKNWTKLNPAVTPVSRYAASAAYDGSSQQVILFGGEGGDINQGPLQALADTWAWNGSNWIDERQTSGPPARWMASTCYDEARHVVVLYGGPADSKTGVPLDDTWIWNGSAWRQAVQ